MPQIVQKKVKLNLTRVDSNAFSILGAFQDRAKKEGWTKEEISAVQKEAMDGNYDHLLATIMEHTK